MSKFIMMIGISGSGKSTIANSLKGFKVVSSDAIREELYGDASDQRNPEIVFQIAHKRICEYLEIGMDVVFDATNLQKKYRKELLEKVSAISDVQKDCWFVDTSVEDCIKLQSTRERKVPKEVIRKQAKKLEYPAEDEGWDYVFSSSGLPSEDGTRWVGVVGYDGTRQNFRM